MRNRICLCIVIIACFVNFAVLFLMAAEEQIFRDELKSENSDPAVSYEKYQKDLAKLLKSKEPKSEWSFRLEYVLFPLSAIALGIVVVFFIRQIQRNLIREVRGDEEPEIAADQVDTEKVALARAETAVESNDFRGALRYLYLSAILHLQERGILPYDKSLTNREYLHQSPTDIDLQTTLGPAVSVFDEVWYGHRPCDAETVADYRNLLQKIYSD
ncbi:MAG: DUF4129 domain-containing protein [Candidatus Poribacteria bacterium]|nr:DUF4129 domain-containing protein [Candidatus Poribacteria bacterium]